MGLFDKKYCDVCGEKIRFLSNRKLEDGNLCKDCAGKLSPWFSDRRRSTVSEIKAQLADREENKSRVAAFRADRTLGEGNLLCIDEGKGQFMVRRSGETLGDNPDVLNLRDIALCEVEIEDSKTEEKQRDSEGKLISYNPPRYTYRYTFYLHIRLNHAYLEGIRFRISKTPVEIKTGLPVQTPAFFAALNITAANDPRPENDPEYRRYQALGIQMRQALTGREAPAPQAAPAFAAKKQVQCPGCSATVYPDGSGCCPYCGTRLA